jgi:hypothetical protein
MIGQDEQSVGKPLETYIPIVSYEVYHGVTYVSVDCHNYDEFRSLPGALLVGSEGDKVVGKSAWDSDKNVAYYRSDARVGKSFLAVRESRGALINPISHGWQE